MKWYSRENRDNVLPQTVESRTKMLNIPLGIIPMLVWNICLNFDLYLLENSGRRH